MKLMLKAVKISLVEKEDIKGKIKKLTYWFLALILLIALFSFLAIETFRLTGVNEEYESETSKAKGFQFSIESQQKIIESYDINLTKSSLTKEDFIEFIGSAAKKSKCDINILTGGVLTTDASVSKINFKIEVSGSISSIHSLLSKLDTLDAKYILNSMSMRNSDEFLWLNREVSSSNMLSWWDISNLHENKQPTTAEEVLSIDKIYAETNNLFYIDVDFVMPNF